MNILKKSILATIIFRAYLHLLSIISIKYLPFKPGFPYWDSDLSKLGERRLWLWASFDGTHYTAISNLGYQKELTQAFFPIYPLLIRLLNFITSNPIISGLIISHLFLLLFIYFFFKLGSLDYKKSQLWQSFLFLLLFPTSFYFFSVYTESFFLFLATTSLYLARKKKFLLSSLLVSLATATKLVGVFLVPAILWEYYILHKKDYKNLSKIIPYGLISSTGIMAYLYFLHSKFNDALIFVRSQPGFGAGRQIDKLTMFYQVVFRYLKMFIAVDPKSSIYPVLWLELVLSLVFLGLIIYALVKKMRTSYLIFMIPSFILPTLTGTFSSMPRYVLTCFPLFYLLGNIKSKKQKIVLYFIFFLIQAWAFTRFASGQWIS